MSEPDPSWADRYSSTRTKKNTFFQDKRPRSAFARAVKAVAEAEALALREPGIYKDAKIGLSHEAQKARREMMDDKQVLFPLKWSLCICFSFEVVLLSLFFFKWLV